MKATSESLSTISRFPITWREFPCFPLRLMSSTRSARDRAVEAVNSGRLALFSDGSSNQQDNHYFAKYQPKRPVGTMQPDCDRVENECNSALSSLNSGGLEYPNGFEAWA